MKTLESQTAHRNSARGRILTVNRFGSRILSATVVFLAISLFGIAIVLAAGSSTTQWDECADYDPTLGSCTWQKSNIAQNQSAYMEGAAVPVRWIATVITDTVRVGSLYVDTYSWEVDWGTTLNHGFDWLVTWDQASRLHQDYIGVPLTLNICGNLANDKPALSVCNLVTSPTAGRLITITAPGDPYLSGICGPYIATCSTQDRLNAFEQIYGTRYLEFYIPATTATITPTLQLWHTQASGSDYLTASYIGYTLTITSTAQITSSMINFASHLGLSGDLYSNPMAWGEYPVADGGVGAAPISGANWHHLSRYLNGAGAANEMQVVLAGASAAPILSSRNTGLITTSGVQVTDTITMTHASQDPQIFGTVKFYVCGPVAIPDLSNPRNTSYHGCTSGGTLLDTAPGPDVPLTVITSSNQSTAISPVFTPVQTGYYCFRAAYTPSGSAPRPYPPISDTNPFSLTTLLSYPDPAHGGTVNVNVSPECFQAQKTTAVQLSNFTARTGGGLTLAGFPVVGLMIGLLGMIVSAGVGVVAWKARKS